MELCEDKFKLFSIDRIVLSIVTSEWLYNAAIVGN